jgi:hypothetical protein
VTRTCWLARHGGARPGERRQWSRNTAPRIRTDGESDRMDVDSTGLELADGETYSGGVTLLRYRVKH